MAGHTTWHDDGYHSRLALSEWRNEMAGTMRQLKMYEPACYSIRVRGAVEARWTERFEPLRISRWQVGREETTEFVGTLIDQAALLTILASLDELGLALLSIGVVARH